MQDRARRLVAVIAIAAATLAIDQASKWLILEVVMDPPRTIFIAPFFNLRLGFNTGISFGMFGDVLQRWPELLALFKLTVAAAFLLWASVTPDHSERLGLALIAGGALGNALDRWRQGAVTDFLDIHWGDWHWPTFNGADIAISLGVAAMLFASLPLRRRRDERASPAKQPCPEQAE